MNLRRVVSDWGRCPQAPGIYRIPARIAGAVDWRRWRTKGSSSFSRTVQRSRLRRNRAMKTMKSTARSFSWIRQVESRGYSPRKSSSRGVKIPIALRGGSSRPAIPAAESALGSHPCVALSSAQVLPEWINRNPAGNALAANGDNSLDSVSHTRGSVHLINTPPPSSLSLSVSFATPRSPTWSCAHCFRTPSGTRGMASSLVTILVDPIKTPPIPESVSAAKPPTVISPFISRGKRRLDDSQVTQARP